MLMIICTKYIIYISLIQFKSLIRHTLYKDASCTYGIRAATKNNLPTITDWFCVLYYSFAEMAPNTLSTRTFTGVLNENDAETIDGGLLTDVTTLKKAEKRTLKLNYRNITLFTIVHLSALYGLWLMVSSARLYTSIFGKSLRRLYIWNETAKSDLNLAGTHFSLLSVHHIWLGRNGRRPSIMGA